MYLNKEKRTSEIATCYKKKKSKIENLFANNILSNMDTTLYEYVNRIDSKMNKLTTQSMTH
jgi:hypothetical protein